MQQLAIHFSRKKADFVNFFSGILQVIQKLAHDIQHEIDKEYNQSIVQCKDVELDVILDACMKMQQNRVQVYHEMIDRLYVTLKNFANQLGKGRVQQLPQLPNSSSNQQLPQLQPRNKISNTESCSEVEVQYQRPVINRKQTTQPNGSQIIRLGPVRVTSKQPEVRTPQNSHKINHQANPVQIPSPFTQKLKQNFLKQSNQQKPQSSTQRSKQKLEILKKTDVCQSLDNYLNKEAKQMLQRSLSRQSSHSSMRKSLSKNFDTPQRPNHRNNYESSQIDKRIEQKLGSYGDSSGKYHSVINSNSNSNNNSSKKFAENMISPIQRYNFQ